MQITSANPNMKWEGFQPAAYFLDLQKVSNLPLTGLTRTPEGQQEEVPVVFAEVLQTLVAQQIGDVSWFLESGMAVLHPVTGLPALTISTPAGEVVVGGPSFNLKLLEAFLDLRKDGINGFEVFWFWYDYEYNTKQPNEGCYRFFVVHQDRIVREQMSFFDGTFSGFDPSVFKTGEDSDPIWSRNRDWEQAKITFWYRKFYQETSTGQMMVLRPDKPQLYHYTEGRWRSDVAFALLQGRLAKIHSLLCWLLVSLAVIAGLLLWR